VSEPASVARRAASWWWLAVIVVHLALAVIWWWMMPAGFPLSHPRFWLHRVIPFVLVAFAIPFVVPRAKSLRPALLVAIPATYLGAAIAGRVLFPITLQRYWLVPLVAGLVLAVVWALEHRARWRRSIAVALPGIALGSFLAIAHRAPLPSTHPRNAPFPSQVDRESQSIAFDAGAIALDVYPVLTFISRSPDRCWTVLSPSHDGSERSTLATRTDERGTLHVESFTEVLEPVYTHLNSYTSIAVGGYRRLFLAFSPAPDARIEVLPADYPAGRPARFAYVDADRVFRVVQASDAEKGPFSTLASGRLAPADPLSITLYDGEAAVARITFDDFAAQASTELSPTAGWNVPQNAVEFRLVGTFANLFITLAGTGVGRGFDSVGHAPGVYRNRMRIERL
jgi:hypothetical protein